MKFLKFLGIAFNILTLVLLKINDFILSQVGIDATTILGYSLIGVVLTGLNTKFFT